MKIDKEFIDSLLGQAEESPRRRMNFDMRTSPEDTSQRMLNALLPGTAVPIHRHHSSTETVILLRGSLDEIFYDVNANETGRVHLDPETGKYGCQVPAGVWHTVEVHAPSVIFEAKDGAYSNDGSETLTESIRRRVADFVEMERRSCSMQVMTPEYVARCLQISIDDAAEALGTLGE